jgi:hypothetical protein
MKLLLSGIAALFLATGAAQARQPAFSCSNGVLVYTYPKTKPGQILIQLPKDRDLSSKIEIQLVKLLTGNLKRETTTGIDGVEIDGKGCKMNE